MEGQKAILLGKILAWQSHAPPAICLLGVALLRVCPLAGYDTIVAAWDGSIHPS